MRKLLRFIKDLYQNKGLIFLLAKNDFKTRYAGSYFGTVWAIVQSIITILIFWFVFEVGFRQGSPVEGYPFIVWLACGMIPWFFFSEAWASGTGAFIEYGYLVKKVKFNIKILPMVKICSSLFIHSIFIVILLITCFLNNVKIHLIYVQFLYYTLCMIILSTALSFITGSLVLFFRDLTQIVGIILQFGMWLTPIMWNIDMAPENIRWLFKLNPMYYVVFGYRDTVIYQEVFYADIKQTIYFWTVSLVLMAIGFTIYLKTKPHFADVL